MDAFSTSDKSRKGSTWTWKPQTTAPFSDSLSSITSLSPLPRPFDPTHRRTTFHATLTRHSALQYHNTTSSGPLKGHIMEALINLLVCIIPSQIYDDVPDHAMLPINNTPHHLNTSTLSSQTMAHNSRKWPPSPDDCSPMLICQTTATLLPCWKKENHLLPVPSAPSKSPKNAVLLCCSPRTPSSLAPLIRIRPLPPTPSPFSLRTQKD